jgi:hypothetical protein
MTAATLDCQKPEANASESSVQKKYYQTATIPQIAKDAPTEFRRIMLIKMPSTTPGD